jgi:hypothetical protein
MKEIKYPMSNTEYPTVKRNEDIQSFEPISKVLALAC